VTQPSHQSSHDRNPRISVVATTDPAMMRDKKISSVGLSANARTTAGPISAHPTPARMAAVFGVIGSLGQSGIRAHEGGTVGKIVCAPEAVPYCGVWWVGPTRSRPQERRKPNSTANMTGPAIISERAICSDLSSARALTRAGPRIARAPPTTPATRLLRFMSRASSQA
jgi:hypothetical protein